MCITIQIVKISLDSNREHCLSWFLTHIDQKDSAALWSLHIRTCFKFKWVKTQHRFVFELQTLKHTFVFLLALAHMGLSHSMCVPQTCSLFSSVWHKHLQPCTYWFDPLDTNHQRATVVYLTWLFRQKNMMVSHRLESSSMPSSHTMVEGFCKLSTLSQKKKKSDFRLLAKSSHAWLLQKSIWIQIQGTHQPNHCIIVSAVSYTGSTIQFHCDAVLFLE